MDSDYSESSDEEMEIQNVELLNSVLEDDKEEEAQSEWSQYQGSETASSTATGDTRSRSITKVETALGINKLMEEKLRRLEHVLMIRLAECRQTLVNVRAESNDNEKAPEKRGQFLPVHCGKPYFKDQNRFPAPENNDTKVMRKAGVMDMVSMVSVQGWTVKDKREFVDILLKLSKQIKKDELQSLLSQYQREVKINETKAHHKKIRELSNEIQALENKNLTDLALPIDQEYDWEFIEIKLSMRHNANEYRALWKLFLHPSINKAPWNRQENFSLQTIAQNNHLQDWDDIARQLNTGRTGYQVFVYFRTNLNNSLIGKKWTKDEEEYLKRLVEYYKQDGHIPWAKIAPKMPNRTKLQIYNKYLRAYEKKGRFLPEEDAVILTCLEKFGPDFKKISEYLNGRSPQQVRNRYYVLKKCNRISTVWTLDEDRKLVQFMANTDGVNYADLVKHFPGKDRVNIRSRYLTLVKWMKLNPKKDISKAPRRGARRLKHGKAANDLSLAINKLKNRMQTELKTRKKKQSVSISSSEEMIEEQIIIALMNEKLREETKTEPVESIGEPAPNSMQVTPENISATNLKKLLILMRAKLDKQKFEKNCPLAAKYPSLLDDNVKDVVPLKRVCSYSKTGHVQEIKCEEKIDIWGNPSTHKIDCVLPPCLATITGCKQLINLKQPDLHVRYDTYKRISKKNEIFQTQWKLLVERLQLLFVWPLLLSNKQPMSSDLYFKHNEGRMLPSTSRIGIPEKTYSKPKTFTTTLASTADIKKSKNDDKVHFNRVIEDNKDSMLPSTSKCCIPKKTYPKTKTFATTLVSTADIKKSKNDDKIDVNKVIIEDNFKTMKPYSTSP